MAFRRSGVRTPSAPPAFARSAVQSEGCRAEARSAQAGRNTDDIRAPSFGPACRHQISAVHFSYVYILQSEFEADRFYTGVTGDLRARLKKHNEGGVPHTARFRPWRIKTAIAFTEE